MNVILHHRNKIVSTDGWRDKINEIGDPEIERDLLMDMCDKPSTKVFFEFTSEGTQFDTAEFTRSITVLQRVHQNGLQNYLILRRSAALKS